MTFNLKAFGLLFILLCSTATSAFAQPPSIYARPMYHNMSEPACTKLALKVCTNYFGSSCRKLARGAAFFTENDVFMISCTKVKRTTLTVVAGASNGSYQYIVDTVNKLSVTFYGQVY